MQPTNYNERKKAFRSFLLMFLITTGLIITIASFSVQVPIKDNEKYRLHFQKMESENMLTDTLRKKFIETSGYLDSINLPGQKQVEELQARIKRNIEDMYAIIERSTDAKKEYYKASIASLSELSLAKRQVRENSENINYKEKYEKIIKDVDDDAKERLRKLESGNQ